MYVKIYSVKIGWQSWHLFGNELPTMLAICSFCGSLIVLICLLMWGFDVDLMVSDPEFTYLICVMISCNFLHSVPWESHVQWLWPFLGIFKLYIYCTSDASCRRILQALGTIVPCRFVLQHFNCLFCKLGFCIFRGFVFIATGSFWFILKASVSNIKLNYFTNYYCYYWIM